MIENNKNASPRRLERIHAMFSFLLVAAALLAYSNNFTAGFVYDDYPFILENPAVRTLSNPVRFFTSREAFSDKGEYVIYRPLATLSFALNYALGGSNAAGYHTVNIFLHIIAGASVYVFVFSTFGDALFAFLVSLLFLLHPVQTEAVSWIAGRGNPMFLSLLLVALLFYRKWEANERRWIFYGLALLFASLSLLSKEMAVVLPVLLVVCDITLPNPAKRGEPRSLGRGELFRRLVSVAPFMALSASYVVLRHLTLGETKQIEYWGGGLWPTFLTMTKGFTYYVRLMFIPMPLMVEYMVPISRSPLQPVVIISLLALASLAVVCVKCYRRTPIVCFGIAWFFASLLPVSNVIPLEAIINERFLYLPSLGFCAILASPAFLMKSSGRNRNTARAIAALLTVALCYGVLTFGRNRDWRDSFSLWTASVKASPAGPTSRYNLGLELFKRGRYDEAIKHLRIACALQESFPYAHATLGNVYYTLGRYDAAIEEYSIGLRQWASSEGLRHNLAMAWFEKGKAHSARQEPDLAAHCYRNTLKFEPGFVPAIRALEESSRTSEPKMPRAK